MGFFWFENIPSGNPVRDSHLKNLLLAFRKKSEKKSGKVEAGFSPHMHVRKTSFKIWNLLRIYAFSHVGLDYRILSDFFCKIKSENKTCIAFIRV
jgi:hypothetical protein